MNNPNIQHNRTTLETIGTIGKQLETVHARILDNIQNSGELREFYKLCGERDALSNLSLELAKSFRPE